MNNEMEKALRHVYERAKIWIEAPTDHAKLVAATKLKDACAGVARAERLRKETLKRLADAEDGFEKD
jgi:hypothetical protein